MEVDPVKQRSGKSGSVALDLHRRTGAFPARITKISAETRVWHELQSEKETAYLFKSEAMRERLLTARQRTEGIDLEETRKELDI